ncbi:sensor histidine kinase N-terminal domain-containing protein [Chelatococcus sambhunathii]|uniref:histidine kinase n=1 Tax=Chelatococcus sambhunathii TaxID=363953 RepID=A0ABU1DKE7_9HYPH|nr:ATP-binding protein [Chelatococcus sambhunathii]MDR4308595.1 sensor histidine kinase N-terminal domain-containing protein [Chelatococcus sambhunathii]
MRSLRARIATALFLLLGAVGIAAVVGAYFVVEGEPDELLDDQLRQIAMNVGDHERSLPPPDPPIEAEDAILIVIRDASGAIIRRSDDTVDLPPAKATGFSDPVVKGEQWRSYAIVTPDRLIQAAQRQHTRDELAAGAALEAVVPIAILIPLSWIVLGVVITRLFRPLDRLTEELRATPAERARPLSTEGLPSEVAPLVAEVNALLKRQNDLLEMRKRFVSDAAHQLRTPLTALQLQIGDLARAPGAGGVSAEIAEIRRGVARMARLTTQLLALARAEAPDEAGAPPAAELGPILRQTIETLLPLAEQRGIDLGVTTQVEARVACREQDLAAALMNLVDNAVRYSPAGGRVDVSSERTGDGVRVVVRDTGPGVEPSELERMFDRFARGARSPSGGAGLGLAIVKAAAARSGMQVRLDNASDPPGLAATVDLPAAS